MSTAGVNPTEIGDKYETMSLRPSKKTMTEYDKIIEAEGIEGIIKHVQNSRRK